MAYIKASGKIFETITQLVYLYLCSVKKRSEQLGEHKLNPPRAAGGDSGQQKLPKHRAGLNGAPIVLTGQVEREIQKNVERDRG